MHTRTENGVPLKLLPLIDEYTRQCLTIQAQRGLRSGDILAALSEVSVVCPNVSGVVMDPSSSQKRSRNGDLIMVARPTAKAGSSATTMAVIITHAALPSGLLAVV